jgi:hypothetical protein
MAIPASLKFDVRVRERLVSDGLLAESEVQSHLEALPDLESQIVELTIKQPALQNESDRDIVIVRTSGVRPPVAPIRPADDDIPIIDDDDDDDDDDLDAKKPEAKKPVEKPKAAPPKAEEAEDKADDDDDDDDDDEEESESKEVEGGGETP